MENDMDIPPTLNKISKLDLSNFYILFANIKESKKLLESYKKFTNGFFESLNSYYKQLTEINCHFLREGKFKSSFTKTPIFQLGKAIKRIIEVQIDSLFSIISDSKIFDAFNNSIINLEKILNYSSINFDKKFLDKNAENISIPLCEKYSQIEDILIDKYIFEKYNKHINGFKNESIDKEIELVKYLEKTFSDFEEETKIKFIDNLKLMENKAVNLLNEMKNMINNILELLYKKEKQYLEVLEKETKAIKEMEENCLDTEDKNDNENNLIGEFDIENIIEMDNYKYTMKIIDKPNITIEEEKKNKKEEKNKDKRKNTVNKNNINELILTKEDIYNIISKFYEYDFTMINKSAYNLDIEKEKLETANLSEKLLSFDIEQNISESITEEEINRLFDLIKQKENLKRFFMCLNNYRIKGNYEMTENVFSIIKKIFFKAQEYLLEKSEKSLESLIIILSQTFYLKKNDKKIYLQEVIKEHPLFKSETFWKNHIEQIIKDELDSIEKDEKEGKIIYTKETKDKKKREIIMTKLLPFTTYMKEFGVNKDTILELINPIMTQYNFDDESKKIPYSILGE